MSTEGRNGGEKTGGRVKGSGNKTTQAARELFLCIMEGEVEYIKTAFEEVRNADPIHYLNLLSKFFPYFVPKKIDLTTDGETISRMMIVPESVATKLINDIPYNDLDKGIEADSDTTQKS